MLTAVFAGCRIFDMLCLWMLLYIYNISHCICNGVSNKYQVGVITSNRVIYKAGRCSILIDYVTHIACLGWSISTRV